LPEAEYFPAPVAGIAQRISRFLQHANMVKTMIKVSSFYPNTPGKHFDIEYFCKQHMPMVQQKLGDACKGIGVESGLSGMPGTPAPHIAIAYMIFESVQAFQQSFGAHLAEIMADIPNYTDLQPTLQISEIRL
jgi:uncharacterized protein (TIGR02118 family)